MTLAVSPSTARFRVHDDPARAAGGAGHQIGRGLQERAGDGVVEARRRGVAFGDGIRKLGVEHGSRRVGRGDVAVHAGVQRNRVVMGADERRDPPGEPVVENAGGGHVVGGRHLRVGAGQVEVERAVRDRHAKAHADRDVAHQIVVDVVPEIVYAVGKAPQHGPGLGRGIVLADRLAFDECVCAVERDGLGDPLGADFQAPEGRADVGHVDVRQSAVGLEDLDEVRVQLASFDDLHGRDADAFLEDLGVLDGHAARHPAADVHVVDEPPAVGDHAALVVVGPDQVKIGQVRRHALRKVGVVRDDHVAGLNFDRADGVGRRNVDRGGFRARRPGEDLAFEIDQPDREVRGLVDEDRARGALHGDPHLVRDRGHLVGQDFQ